jgi:hypothetical protein
VEPVPELREELLAYSERRPAAVDEPGLYRIASSLGVPPAEWLPERLSRFIGVHFTSSGYGYLDDETVAAAHVVKAAETAGMLSPALSSLPPFWTIEGGFSRLWERVAQLLRDVRPGCAPRFVERRGGRVRVVTPDGTLEFDRLIVASPLQHASRFSTRRSRSATFSRKSRRSTIEPPSPAPAASPSRDSSWSANTARTHGRGDT